MLLVYSPQRKLQWAEAVKKYEDVRREPRTVNVIENALKTEFVNV
jgi:hypothetical protein